MAKRMLIQRVESEPVIILCMSAVEDIKARDNYFYSQGTKFFIEVMEGAQAIVEETQPPSGYAPISYVTSHQFWISHYQDMSFVKCRRFSLRETSPDHRRQCPEVCLRF